MEMCGVFFIEPRFRWQSRLEGAIIVMALRFSRLLYAWVDPLVHVHSKISNLPAQWPPPRFGADILVCSSQLVWGYIENHVLPKSKILYCKRRTPGKI